MSKAKGIPRGDVASKYFDFMCFMLRYILQLYIAKIFRIVKLVRNVLFKPCQAFSHSLKHKKLSLLTIL